MWFLRIGGNTPMRDYGNTTVNSDKQWTRTKLIVEAHAPTTSWSGWWWICAVRSSICAVIERGCPLTCSLIRVWKLSTRSSCVLWPVPTRLFGHLFVIWFGDLEFCCVLGDRHILSRAGLVWLVCLPHVGTVAILVFWSLSRVPIFEALEGLLISWSGFGHSLEALFISPRRLVCSRGHILLETVPGSYGEAWFGHVLSPFWRQLACEGHPYLHRGELWVDLPATTVCLKFVTILLTLPASFSESLFFFSLFHLCSFSLSAFSSSTFKFWVLSLGCLP